MDMLMPYMALWVAGANELDREPIDIGSRRELFVDDYLIEVLEEDKGEIWLNWEV